MAKWNVTVYTSYETEVEADTEEEAWEKAVTESPFPYGFRAVSLVCSLVFERISEEIDTIFP